MSEETELITKYRPDTLAMVLGQDTIVKSIQANLDHGSAKTFLFSGQSGVGKTTLARIMAAQFGCPKENIMEIDAATHTGVDAMRSLTEMLGYVPLGPVKLRAVIVDECHALSQPAWKSLLKAIEEPPSGLYWFFCTTDLGRVPSTIKTRCALYCLKLVSTDDLIDLVTLVAELEKMPATKEVLDVVGKEAFGSPRQALSNLAVCSACTDVREALSLLRAAGGDNKEISDFCSKLIRGKLQWENVHEFMAAFKESDPESVRLAILGYLTKVLAGTKAPNTAAQLLGMMEAFETPCYNSNAWYQIWLSMGRLFFDAKEE